MKKGLGMMVAISSLAIASVERDTGLSKDTLRVWERRYGFPVPARDALGERLYPLEQVDKLRMLKRLLDLGHRPGKVVGLPVDELRRLASATAASTQQPRQPAPDGADELDGLLGQLAAHRFDEFRGRLSQLLLHKGLSSFVADVVAPMNEMVGEAWTRAALQIFEEHLYTEAVQALLRSAIGSIQRVGQNLARVLETRGFEYIALHLDPFRVRDSWQAGDPVVYGDASELEVLRALGVEHASVVVVSFHAPETALRVVRAARRLRGDVPILVRTDDDSRLEELQAAGATEVVPAIFETSLSLVSHVLLFLKVPAREVLETTEDIRHHRYAILRSVFRRRDARPLEDDERAMRQQLRTVVLPPGAVAVGRTIAEIGLEQRRVVVSALRRDGIVGREPEPATRLREGDVLVLWGTPEDLEHGENRLLMG